jgi:hypothetical protein
VLKVDQVLWTCRRALAAILAAACHFKAVIREDSVAM